MKNVCGRRLSDHGRMQERMDEVQKQAAKLEIQYKMICSDLNHTFIGAQL